MTGRDTNDERWLSEGEAADFLRHASQLDAGHVVKLRHVREAALEVGLSAYAVAAAAEDMFEHGTDRARPDWVRMCLIGVPNRTGAQFWYHLLCTAGLASAAGAMLLPSVLSPSVGFAASLWFFGCAAISSKAIRWMDEHAAWIGPSRE
jgi:hypothetical protein